jgi:bifunctional DNA-binding transcriptional regulator/antitoxin component of YhaV-PrlF toxin-antitoxin module|tara:strand:+ start:4779 stop:4961 length:183 start_codon:yes stop_codon:yes gene_type:complete
MSYIIEVEEANNGDVVIPLPDEICEELNWQEGDILEWNLKGNGIVLNKLNDSAGYEVNED